MRIKPTQLIIVYLPALFIDFAFSSVLTNSSFYTSTLNFSSTFLGVLVAIATAFYTFLAIPCGQLSDRIERHRMLYLGCLLIAGVSVLLRFCSSRFHLLLIFPCIGISMALFWPAYEAWLAEREGEAKLIHRVMLFNLFWSTGITMGPTVSGYLYKDTQPFTLLYVAAGAGLITCVTIYYCNSRTDKSILQKESDQTQILFPPPSERKKYLNIARCANFTSWFALGVLRWLNPKLTKDMGISPATFGNLMLALGGMQTITFLFLGTGYSTRWHYRIRPLVMIQGLAILCFVGIWWIDNTVFWAIAFVFIGISVAYTYFGSLYYGLHMHSDKGNKSGWHEAVLGLGSLLGPLFGGIAADSGFGIKSPYLLCAGAILLSIVVEMIINSKKRLAEDVL